MKTIKVPTDAGAQIFRASLHTRNFHFECYSQHNEATAKVKLIDALTKHGKQYRCEPNWFSEFEDDIETMAIELGAGYRDREKIQ